VLVARSYQGSETKPNKRQCSCKPKFNVVLQLKCYRVEWNEEVNTAKPVYKRVQEAWKIIF
jgi:hypothetical protein